VLREPDFEQIGEADDDDLLAEVAEAARLTEAAQQHTGAMVALYPDAATAAELAIDRGEDPDDLHVTLAYLGKAAGLDLDAALKVVADWAAATPELAGEISGVGQFADGPVTYLSVDLPKLPALREELVKALDNAGLPPSKEHGFTPHMTLDYARRRPKFEKAIPITFSAVTLTWAGAQFSFPLGLASPLQEGKWDPSLHPRWPKGTPKAGQFIHVGDRFVSGDGKEWEVSHLVGGKAIANRVDGTFKNAETGVFNPKVQDGEAVIPDAKKEGAPVAIKSSETKGLESGVATVDPYVAPETHDDSIALPQGSHIKPEEWKRFGKLDQEHYVELMQRFGSYKPGKAKGLIDESYKDYEASIQSIVKNAYSSQYGSSSGFSLSLGSIFKAFSGGDKKKLAELDAQRKRSLQLQGRHKDVIAWDLYNRTRSPDVAVFHKNTNGPSYWKSMLDGKKPIMSGLSQSFNFGANWGFGNNTLATPLAIRHVLMSSYSAQPIPGQTHFQGELEIGVAEQIKVDKRSLYFSLHDITENQKKWLMGMTKAPAGGATLERFRDALQKGEMLPTPPAPPDIQMQGQGQKLWIDPPAEAAEFTKRFADKMPHQKSSVWEPSQLDPSGPWAFKNPDGTPKATQAKTSEFKPGDYMVGKKGTLYIVVEDPGDETGFGLRYVKIENGKFTGESYNFEGGGTKNYYKLSAHYNLPDPHKQQAESELFDPNAWINGEGEKFTGQMAEGEKFKVNGNPYEVKNQISGAKTQILDLMTGKVGTINTDYKTPLLIAKEGYVSEEDDEAAPQLEPQKGMTLPYNGQKHTITKILKDGTIKAKPTGGKVIAISPEDEALEDLYDPGAHKIGSKIKVGDLEKGDLFHGGAGQAQRPYKVLDKSGNTVTWKNLDTGEEGTSTTKKTVRQLLDVEAGPEPTKITGAEPVPHEQLEPGVATPISNLKPGDHFEAQGVNWVLMNQSTSPEENPKASAVLPSGALGQVEDIGLSPDAPVTFAGDKPLVAEAPAPSADGFPDHIAEGGFEGYGSKYGSGGKYTHDKLGEMPVGTIFRGKEGKLWKVKASDGDVIVTDGEMLFKADPTVRGRAVQADFVDSTGPLPGPGTDTGQADAAAMLAPNEVEATIGELPVGTTVLVGGIVQKIEKQAGGDAPALTILPDGSTNLLGVAIVPDQVSQPIGEPLEQVSPPLGSLTIGAEVEIGGKRYVVSENKGTTVDLVDSTGQVWPMIAGAIPDKVGGIVKIPTKPEPIDGLHDGDEFKAADGKTYTVIAHALDGIVVMDGEGGMAKAPQDAVTLSWQPEDSAPTPSAVTTATPPPGEFLLGDLSPGEKVAGGSGISEVVAHTVDGNTIVKTESGELGQWNSNSVFKSHQKVDPTDEQHGTVAASEIGNQWSEPVEKALHQAGMSAGDLATLAGAEIDGYGSKWGSGAKYIHYRLNELEPGAVVKDKTGKLFNAIGEGPEGKWVVYSHTDGELRLADPKTRIRRIFE
jgi:2'-5' RNA ligase